MTIKVRAKEALFIKSSDLSVKQKQKIADNYLLRFYEESACKKCEWVIDRHSEICDNCAAYKGGINMSSEVKIGETKYIKTPIGDYKGLKSLLKEDLEVKSHFPDVPMKKRIKFTGTLKEPHQVESLAAIVKKKRGVLKAPPRSGKTVVGTAAACRLKQKTIILCAQNTWLRGFYETFLGSKTQAPLTNATKKQVGYARTLEDFKKYDVCLVTYQTFLSDRGKKLLTKVKDMFGVLIIDEVHGAAADGYALTVSKFNCKYKIGLSGTPARKDNRYKIVENLLGGIIYEAKVERWRPQIRLTRTKYVKTYKGRIMWASMVSAIENDKARLKMIAKWALQDVAAGHMIIIPMSQVKPIQKLTALINTMAGKTIAKTYYGKVNKDAQERIVQACREYKIKVLVGNAKMVSTGLNIPRASMLYEVIISSNIPNAEQRFARVLTPMEGKPQPCIRYFMDELTIRKKCMANEYWGALHKMKPIISEKDLAILKGYFSDKKDMPNIGSSGLYDY